MMLNGGKLGETRILSRKSVELISQNQFRESLKPWDTVSDSV